MAEIESKNGKSSPKVDLTPMVDLNLLLITFFMFSTTLNKPKAMEITMPFKEQKESEAKVKEDAAMTILLGDDHKIYYYEGIGSPENPPVVKSASFDPENNGIRDILIDKKKKVRALQANGTLTADDQLTVIIKPDVTAETDDVVNIIDEMTINDIKIYTITDITAPDHQFITDFDKGSGQ